MKHLLRLLAAALALAAMPVLADSDISHLPPGGLLQTNDYIAVARCSSIGCNYKVQVGPIASLNIGGGLANSGGSLVLVAPTLSTLGGVYALSGATSHQFVTYIDSSGVQHLAQPAASDISGLAAVASSGSASDLTTGMLSANLLPAFSGDLTTSPGSAVATLATVNSSPGTFGSSSQVPQCTITGKGLATSCANVTITPAAIGAPTDSGTGASGTWGISISGNSATATALAASPSQCSGGQFSTGVAANGNANCSSVVGGVSSVFGRSGAVTAQSGDYSVAQISGAAPLASPTLTGTAKTGILDSTLNATALPTAQTGTVHQVANADGVATRIEDDCFGAGCYFSGVRKDGTNASPTTLQSGDEIASLNAWGYNGTAVVGPQAAFREYASQNWGIGANGTYLSLATTPNGSTTLTEDMRVENDGGITIPSTVTGGDKGPGTINASGVIYAPNFAATGIGADILPASTTLNRPGSPVEGDFRDNTTLHELEAYINGGWQQIVSAAGGLVNLASQVTGILPVANGGWGTSTPDFPLGTASYLTPAGLNSFRTCLDGIKGAPGAATGNTCVMAIVGDSTCVGIGVGTGGSQNLTGAYARVWPAQLITLLNAAGIPTEDNSVMGESNITQYIAYHTYDPRVSLGAGWVTNSFTNAPGGNAFTFTNAGSGGYNNASSTASFTPGNQINGFTLYWTQRAAGTVTVNIDGGSALTVSSGLGAGGTTITIPSSYASFSNGSSTFTGLTLGTHTINVVVQSGNPLDLPGIHAFNTTTQYLDIVRICQAGAQMSNMDNASYFGGLAWLPNWFGTINYALVNLTVNDSGNGTLSSSYQTQLNDVYTKWNFASFQKNQFGFLIGPYTTQTGNPVASGPITGQLLSQAATNGQFVYDFASRWIGGATGLTGGDAVHPTFAGTTDIANSVARLFVSN